MVTIFFSLSLFLREYSEKLKSKGERKERVFNGEIFTLLEKVHFLHLLHYSTGAGVTGVQVEKLPCISLHKLHWQESGRFIITRANNGRNLQRVSGCGWRYPF